MAFDGAVTWDSHDINDSTNYTCSLPGLADQADSDIILADNAAGAPVDTAAKPKERTFALMIQITSKVKATILSKRDELAKWFDKEATTSKKLLVTRTGGTAMYWMCRPKSFITAAPDKVAIMLVAADGVARSNAVQTASKAMTAADNSISITNNGNTLARPIFSITPTTVKTGAAWTYYRSITLTNNMAKALTNYPVCITDSAGTGWDTTALVSGGKMQADGDDIRVYEAGVELDYWFGAAGGAAGGPNSTTTKIWCNLNFAPSEVKTLIITYGNSSATAASVDDDYKPMFNLATSTNRLWIYAQFKHGPGHRTGAWSTGYAPEYVPYRYYGYWVARTEFSAGAWTDADPCNKMGLSYDRTRAEDWHWVPASAWKLTCPALVTQVVHNGATKLTATTPGKGQFRLATIDTKGLVTEQWNVAANTSGAMTTYGPITTAIATEAEQVVFEIIRRGGYGLTDNWVTPPTTQDGAYVQSCEITLTTANTPTIVFGAETTTYDIAVMIINQTRNESILLNLSGVGTSVRLDIDTDLKIVKLGTVSKITALTVPARIDWLPLDPGANTIIYQETGMGAVTFAAQWEDRYA